MENEIMPEAIEALAEFETQAELQPGESGWWQVWGARSRDIQAGDILLSKLDDGGIATDYVADLFDPNANGLRVGFIDGRGKRVTIGAMARIVLVRRGTHNTLAKSL